MKLSFVGFLFNFPELPLWSLMVWSLDANYQLMTYDSENITSNVVLSQVWAKTWVFLGIYLFVYLFLELLMELQWWQELDKTASSFFNPDLYFSFYYCIFDNII